MQFNPLEKINEKLSGLIWFKWISIKITIQININNHHNLYSNQLKFQEYFCYYSLNHNHGSHSYISLLKGQHLFGTFITEAASRSPVWTTGNKRLLIQQPMRRTLYHRIIRQQPSTVYLLLLISPDPERMVAWIKPSAPGIEPVTFCVS
jgi:hypothetical protein